MAVAALDLTEMVAPLTMSRRCSPMATVSPRPSQGLRVVAGHSPFGRPQAVEQVGYGAYDAQTAQ